MRHLRSNLSRLTAVSTVLLCLSANATAALSPTLAGELLNATRGAPPPPAPAAAIRANGRVAFDSNRDGNYEIYSMDADGGGQAKLAGGAGVDELLDWQAAQTQSGNPADESRFFVAQHYRDFLNREPDPYGWKQKLEQNKWSYFDQLAASERFVAAYSPSLTPEQYVDALNQNAGGALSPAERVAVLAELKAGMRTHALALRAASEDADLVKAELNRAFVLMQYFGYLRRNFDDLPDADFLGCHFWLAKLDPFDGNFVQAEMVKAFISSIEYRQRFVL